MSVEMLRWATTEVFGAVFSRSCVRRPLCRCRAHPTRPRLQQPDLFDRQSRGKTAVEIEDDVGRHHHESRRAGILVWHHEFSTNERVASARWFDCLDANRQSARTKKLVIVGWERKTAEPEFFLPSASALPPRAKVAICTLWQPKRTL